MSIRLVDYIECYNLNISSHEKRPLAEDQGDEIIEAKEPEEDLGNQQVNEGYAN